MASKKKLLMVSLDDEETKKVAQVMTNDTCRKILDALADKEYTETELSMALKQPISTVHYNLQQLIRSGLVVAEEYHYSKRMKEVMHYKLANQYIIIAPKSAKTYGIKEKLRSILPVALVGIVGSALIHFYNAFMAKAPVASASMLAKAAPMPEAIQAVADEAGRAATDSVAAAPIAEMYNATAQSGPNVALWFLAGCFFIILAWLIIDYIIYLWRRRK
ncbi:helix-turn-helix transcriptional regulator [Candidatus Woesearchaeota archaeon]|nr:helix-turn-helix transcriptional regulator [Candidatus Woesearchaeota archaeon]